MKKSIFIVCLILSQQLLAQTFEKIKDMEAFNGFFNFYYDESKDQLFVEVNKLNEEFLYVNSLAAGVGSNDLGLDRGKLGRTAVVKFVKAGNKLLLIQPNQKFRAITTNEEEKKSVEEAFAKSVLYGFPIVESKNGSYLINVTTFLLRDAQGVALTLKRNKQGAFKVDLSKSALYMDRTKAFPENVEFEALLTFTGEATGRFISSVSPNSSNVTVRQHHSFIQLPDDNYKKREFDVRSGAYALSYFDYATPVESDINKRFIMRHRLEKKNPEATLSEPIEPIIYYLDRGAPEPVRSALLEGGRWWNQAFEAAGYKDAFQFKMLPEDADPLDVRYNVVQWVHRSTRGWSYGSSVADPRTGEIIKGHVSLGSLRIRQDYLIAQALLGATVKTGDDNKLLQMALARIRQLSAHEIGHTLGFTHNFAASVNDRASVMDYPHPLIELKQGKIDVSNAYATGIGAWDKATIEYAYQDFPDTVDESKALKEIIKKTLDRKLNFISDADSRAPGGAHISAHLWDNGSDAVTELERVLKVRKKAIENFSEKNILVNEPYTKLEDVFVPLYFFHRYQLEAAVKLLGGLEYTYATRGDGQTIVSPVDAKVEKLALESVLNAISVSTLKIPERLLKLFPPRAYGFGRNRETFASKTGVAFDGLDAAATATEFAMQFVFHPERASRIVQQKALFEDQLGLDQMINSLLYGSFEQKHQLNYDNEVQQAINQVVLQNLMALAVNEKATFQARSIARSKVLELQKWIIENPKSTLKKSYRTGYLYSIEQFLKNPEKFKKEITPKIPDGSPIGSLRCDFE